MRAGIVSALVVLAVASSVSAASGDALKQPAGHSARYLVASKLARGLRQLCAAGSGGCALKGQAFVIEQVGHEQHVNPGVMVAISFTESSGGDAPCANNPKSIWGLNSCASGYFINGPVPYFRTWYQAFSYFARFLRSRWPDATTVYGLAGYSACDACWQPRTALWAARLGFTPVIGYSL